VTNYTDKKPYPRRRDVRELAETVFETLRVAKNAGGGEFPDDFLNTVRDLMREHVDFIDILVSMEMQAEDAPLENALAEPTFTVFVEPREPLDPLWF
jgi:hypothetical protein